MTEEDKKEISSIIQKLGTFNLHGVIGATLSYYITQEAFDNTMRESEIGLMTPFTCNVSNEIANTSQKISKQKSLMEVHRLVTNLVAIIDRNQK